MLTEASKNVINSYEKFWERDDVSRPTLNFSYSKKEEEPLMKPESLYQQWLDEEFIIENYKKALSCTGFLAEGFPSLFTNLGPGCLAACIGGSYGLAPNTIWFDKEQLIKDWSNPRDILFDEGSEMWQHTLRLQNRYAKEPNVNFSMIDIGGIMDIVASLRSTEELLYDLYDYPEEVIEFAQKVKKLWFEAFDRQKEVLQNAGRVYNTWMNIPSLKPWYPLQCDFCYMISAEHFEKFVLGDIVDQVNYMDRSIYHLDGVGEIPHIDMLLNIKNLSGIQWVPGDGETPVWDKKWFPLYKKIQDKNKNLVLIDGINENRLDEAEGLIKSLDPKGVYISANFSSKEKAEQALEKIIKWSDLS